MSTGRINGQSFDIRLAGILVHVESFTCNVEDNSTVKMNKGLPDGYLNGDRKASGEIEIDIANFGYLSIAAKAAGSWAELPPFDINVTAFGSNGSTKELMHVIAHGCRLKLNDLLNIDPNSSDASTIKIGYDVTDRNFVHVNGVPIVPGTHLDLI